MSKAMLLLPSIIDILTLSAFMIVIFFFYNIIDYNWTRQKINEKYLTKREPKKRQENTAQAHISRLSQIEQ